MQPLLGAVARSAGGDEEVGEAGGGAALPQRRVQRRLERGQRRCLTTCRHRLWLSHQRILCHRRHTESRTRRREVRHSMRQDEGVCGRKPSSTRRHVRARGSTGEHSWCACDFRSWVLSRVASFWVLARHALRSFGTEFCAPEKRTWLTYPKADRLFHFSTTNNSFLAVKTARKQLLVVESVRESTTRGVLVVDFLPPFDNQQLFFLVRSQLPVA